MQNTGFICFEEMSDTMCGDTQIILEMNMLAKCVHIIQCNNIFYPEHQIIKARLYIVLWIRSHLIMFSIVCSFTFISVTNKPLIGRCDTTYWNNKIIAQTQKYNYALKCGDCVLVQKQSNMY